MKNKELFLKELEDLFKKYQVESFGACGCCNGTWVSSKDFNLDNLKYDLGDEFNFEIGEWVPRTKFLTYEET